MQHPADLSIAEVGVALRTGALTVVELVQAHYDRIAARDTDIGAFVHLATDAARVMAQAADAGLAAGDDLGPLHGIPFAVKDLMDVTDWPVRFGSCLHATRIAGTTAPAVQMLIDAGAIPIGLVATYDLGIVGPGDDGLYPQPRNPWNRAHITGGSSSGSAAAVAAGMVRLALGTDTGGSVRSPASYCGIVGIKPTYGVMSGQDILPLAPSLDHVGVMGRTVSDAALGLDALIPRSDQTEPLRIGYARDWFADDDKAHRGVVTLMDNAAATLSLAGLQINLTTLPPYAITEAAAAIIIHAEGFATHRDALQGDGGKMGRMPYQSMAAGAVLSSKDIANGRTAADRIKTNIDRALTQCDALIMPTTLTPAPLFSAFADGAAVWTPMRTIPFNMTGHPAISVPMGFVDGLPIGMQIVGRHGEESMILRIAKTFEAATDHAALNPVFIAGGSHRGA